VITRHVRCLDAFLEPPASTLWGFLHICRFCSFSVPSKGTSRFIFINGFSIHHFFCSFLWFWCHLEQLHQVSNCSTAYSAAFSGVVLATSTTSAVAFSTNPRSSASGRFLSSSRNSISSAGSLLNRARI